MTMAATNELCQLIQRRESTLLDDWITLQLKDTPESINRMSERELRDQSREFLSLVTGALAAGAGESIAGNAWTPVREMLTRMSRSRALQGFSPAQTATFVFSLKQPLFDLIHREVKAADAAAATWQASLLFDSLGLFTTEAHQKTRDEVIQRQQQEMLELSTPVVTLWQGILALPLIGTLDSERTQVVMESLLQRIVDTGSSIAILDITGVPTVDTLVAQHLLKTVAAARLMGADCIISGIRPQIAQTIVHLGVDLNAVVTKATLADAFRVALRRVGLAVTPDGAGANGSEAPEPTGR
jgi:rsbT co-antagonist protein RsbR